MQRRCLSSAPGGRSHRASSIVEQIEPRQLLSAAPLEIREPVPEAFGTFGLTVVSNPARSEVLELDPAQGKVTVIDTANAGTPSISLLQAPLGVSQFGAGAAILDNGTLAVRSVTGSTPQIHLYSRQLDGSYTLQTSILAPSGTLETGAFGTALASMGNTLLVGHQHGTTTSPNGVIFRFDSAGNQLSAFAANAAVGGFGQEVFVSGSRILARANVATPVGTMTSMHTGVVEIDSSGQYVRSYYHPSYSSSSQLDRFGEEFVITQSGKVLIAAPGLNDGTIFQYEGAASVPSAQYANPQPLGFGQEFGVELAVVGDVVYAAAPLQIAANGSASGEVFRLDTTTGTFADPVGNPDLDAPEDFSDDQFGFQIAVAANGALIITNPADDDDGASNTVNAGVIYIYGLDNSAPVNTAPSVDPIAGPASGIRHQELTFAGTFIDPDESDVHTLTWTVADSGGQSLASTSGEALHFFSHVFTSAGTYTVTFTVSDGQAPASSTSKVVTIAESGAVQLDDGTVLVVGSDSLNGYAIHGSGTSLEVWLNGGMTLFTAATGIQILGGSSADVIAIAGNVTLPATIYGGDGIDVIKGGAGNDVIVGGGGGDLIVGGAGRDMLIGGRGSDRIVGNTDDDLIVAGYTIYDSNNAALQKILSEWTSGREYTARVDNIRGSGTGFRANDNYFLLSSDGASAAETVFDDGASDILTGSQGQDWFLANLDAPARDRITDLSATEFKDDLDFISA